MRHLSVFNTSGYLIVLIVSSFTGYIVGAILCDKIGRRASFILFAIGSFVLGMIYTMLPITDGMMLALGFPLGIVVQGIFAGVGAYLSELIRMRFADRARASATAWGAASARSFRFSSARFRRACRS